MAVHNERYGMATSFDNPCPDAQHGCVTPRMNLQPVLAGARLEGEGQAHSVEAQELDAPHDRLEVLGDCVGSLPQAVHHGGVCLKAEPVNALDCQRFPVGTCSHPMTSPADPLCHAPWMPRCLRSIPAAGRSVCGKGGREGSKLEL